MSFPRHCPSRVVILASTMSCDLEVFNKGHFLTRLIDQPGPMPLATLDALCALLTKAAAGKVRFDWHPIGGIPQLLYLGEHVDAKAAFLQCLPEIKATSVAYYHEWYAQHPEIGSWHLKDYKSCIGEEIAGPGMITVGQMMHGKPRQ